MRILVECLTLWLTNLLCAAAERLEGEHRSLLDTLAGLSGDIILVSNETGLGVVPLGELTRRAASFINSGPRCVTA